MTSPTSSTAPQGVEAYFTDVEHLRSIFKDAILSPTLARRLLIVHGVGGAGKSSLLQMFRLECKRNKIPVALASGDESKSVVDIFYRKAEAGDERGWAPDLKADGVTLPAFARTWEHYRAIQAKVEAQVRKEASVRAAEIAGKAASKTAEAAAGAAFGAALGSLAPGIGTAAGAALGGVVGGMGAEAFVDWLRSSLNLGKPDIDLLLDPAKALSEDFLADIAKAAATKRIVLMLDTYEQLTALDDWAREFAQRLHPNVLLVIAGRAVPDWQRQWPGWLAQAQVEEVKPMTDEIMRELAVRYYRTLRGSEPDPVQVEAIVRFARGLPVVVTSAINIWVEYGVEDFQSVKSQVVADLVDRLMEGVPAEMAPLLEAAAAVRWFNKEILRAVTQTTDVNVAYNELRRFPFARPRAEGFMLHDTVREMIDANLKVEDPEHYRELHERAAAHFEARLAKVAGEEAERLALERLYHRVCADEEAGMQLFQEMAEELAQYRLVMRLRALTNDFGSHPLEAITSRLWRDYYNARLAHLELREADAEVLYEQISESTAASERLRAYALGDWGAILERSSRLFRPGGKERALRVLHSSISLLPDSDIKKASVLASLCGVFARLQRFEQAINYAMQANELAEKRQNRYEMIMVASRLKGIYLMKGNWLEMMNTQTKMEQMLTLFPQRSNFLADKVYGANAIGLLWLGRYKETEDSARRGIAALRELGVVDTTGTLRDTAFAMGMQECNDEAEQLFRRSIEVAKQLGYLQGEGISLGFLGKVQARQGGFNEALRSLERSLEIKRNVYDNSGIVEVLFWLGEVEEQKLKLKEAEDRYYQCVSEQTARSYYLCGANTGRCRIRFVDGDLSEISIILAQAEQLAQQYEYNDHLASLRLTQGHIAWDGRLDAWGVGFEAALHHYQQALVYALRFNRFLLDEALAGRLQGTPLQPILPICLARGEEGRRMLTALRDWWQTGVNDVGVPRPDTISPLAEGIPLLEAERIAREREPGDGSPQTPVLARLAAVLEP